MHESNETGTNEQTMLPSYANRKSVAPWWHTALLITLLLGFSFRGFSFRGFSFRGFSFLGSRQPTHRTLGEHHIAQYLLTLLWELALAALVLWGIRMRGVPLRQLLGERRSTLRDWRDDFVLAAAFWIAAIIVLAAIGVMLKLAHFPTPQKTLAQLAPQNALELAVWVLLCIAAGICEELIFRGYLLQQFTRAGKNIWIGVLVSSLIFGVSHGYEGASGMIAITVFGAMFCALAIKRGSLRPGIIAHAWHDIFSGVALMLLHHARAL